MTTFDEAVAAVSSATKDRKRAEDWVTALIALGLLKVDPSNPEFIDIPYISCGNGLASVRIDATIETLRMAGYDVRDCVRRP